MELDPRLRWAPWLPHTTVPTGLYLGHHLIAMLSQRVDNGAWSARLAAHRGIAGPDIMRHCTSFEAGQRGCEVWAMRHMDRLLVELAAIEAKRPKHLGAG